MVPLVTMTWRRLTLQCGDRLVEVKDLPNCDAEIQESDAAYGPTHPTGCDDGLQTVNAGFLRGI
jgi:hypothetical protein